MDTFGNRSDIRRDRGALEVISFAGSKVLTTCGEGGMIVTNDRELAERYRHLRELFSKMPRPAPSSGSR
jgi:hypothetical protein